MPERSLLIATFFSEEVSKFIANIKNTRNLRLIEETESDVKEKFYEVVDHGGKRDSVPLLLKTNIYHYVQDY